MRRTILTLGIITGIWLLSITTADTCGDKSLRIGRGARFQRTTHPAAVLIYAPDMTAAETPKLQSLAPRLQSFLKGIGHKARTVRDADMLGEALTSGQYDVVLTDLAEAASLQKQIDSLPSKPVVVPVASKETKAQVAAAKKQYTYVVKDPNSADQYLEGIEGAIRSRMRVLAKRI
jgi:hypothetical protein